MAETAPTTTACVSDTGTEAKNKTDGTLPRNTIEEKRTMRNIRKKKKRNAIREAKEAEEVTLQKRVCLTEDAVRLEQTKRVQAESDVKKYKGMARTYFDRFCWEVQERRDIMKKDRLAALGKHQGPSTSKSEQIFHEINPDNLQDPIVAGKQEAVYVGRGSFGIVKVQVYHGIKVAVKEYLARCVEHDVRREAAFLSHLCHPFLPLLIGICTRQMPLRLVTQFHGVKSLNALTLWKELQTHQVIAAGSGWLILTGQLMEALRYLHMEAKCVHNDIKPDNILITAAEQDLPSTSRADLPDFQYQIVLIDFGKATTIRQKCCLQLTQDERAVYKRKYPHIAAEVIDGITSYSAKSDMFSVGRVLQKVAAEKRYFNLPDEVQEQLTDMHERCISLEYDKRPEAEQLLKEIRDMVY